LAFTTTATTTVILIITKEGGVQHFVAFFQLAVARQASDLTFTTSATSRNQPSSN